MRNLWVVRHGERLDKVDRKWARRAPRGAWDDPPLTERGLNQATEVGKRLTDEDEIDFVFVSPFVRCLQTATNIVRQLPNANRLKLFVEPGFIEALSCTQFPPGCLPASELAESFPFVDTSYTPFLTTFQPEYDDLQCEGRIADTLHHILDSYPTGNVLVVSHGSPIAAVHTVLNGKYTYVGICTISHYLVDDNAVACNSSPSNQENNNAVRRPKRRNGSLNNPKSHPVHAQRSFKCQLAGDSSHLSDRTNLHDHF